jgi:hypothetical protein
LTYVLSSIFNFKTMDLFTLSPWDRNALLPEPVWSLNADHSRYYTVGLPTVLIYTPLQTPMTLTARTWTKCEAHSNLVLMLMSQVTQTR